MTETTEPTTLSKAQAASKLGCGVATVDRLRRAGQLQATRVHGQVRLLADSVDEYLASTWQEYWSDVERIAAAGPLPSGDRAARLAQLFNSGQQRLPQGRAPVIREAGNDAA